MSLVKINKCLIVLIVLVNGYIIGAPFLPQILFSWQSHHGKAASLNARISKPVTAAAENGNPIGNSVVIPSMLLDQSIHEGDAKNSYAVLNQGIWRWPASSTPDKGGNTVLLGHRFTYALPKGVLYYLDKVRAGDQVAVFWNNQRYVYTVTQVKIVQPTDTSILSNTTMPRLTIYTCTPLFNPKQRLVVIAERQPI